MEKGKFATNRGAVLAAAGSAIGLGNVWRFPYITGANGGFAFIIVYILALIIFGYPVLTSELWIGKKAQLAPYAAYPKLLDKNKSSWSLVGIVGCISILLVLSFYSIVAGWAMYYMYVPFTTGFSEFGKSIIPADFFGATISSFQISFICFLIFILLTAIIVALGVEKGIEYFSNIAMPLLFILLLIFVVRSLTLPKAADGLKFMFYPDFSKITLNAILAAVGQAFFTLSIGSAIMVTYASYHQDEGFNMKRMAVYIIVLDTVVALIAGAIIFPALFSFGIDNSSGPGLIFVVLPQVLAKLPMSNVFGFLLFFLIFIIAITSSISLLEPFVLYLISRFNFTRIKAVISVTTFIIILGFLNVMSMVPHSFMDFKILGKFNLFDFFDTITSGMALPLTGLFSLIFTTWVVEKKLNFENAIGGKFLYVMAKYLSVALLIIYSIINFLDKFGIYSFFK